MSHKATMKMAFRDFLGQLVEVSDCILYPGGNGEMVLAVLVEVVLKDGIPGNVLKVVPIRRSTDPDGYCAQHALPVRIHNWGNVVKVSSGYTRGDNSRGPEWVQ